MRRRIVVTIIILGLVAVLAVGLTALKKRGFQAFENPPIAEFSATITEDGNPATGQLLIDGDCPTTELGAVDGGYYCELTTTNSSAQGLVINSLSFFSYANDLTLQIPLYTHVPTESQPFALLSGEKLILDIAIDTPNNSVAIRRWNDTTSQFEPFPPPES